MTELIQHLPRLICVLPSFGGNVIGFLQARRFFVSGSFYGFAVSPSNGDVMAMVADRKVAANNKMVRYIATGSKVKEYVVGVGPNGRYIFS